MDPAAVPSLASDWAEEHVGRAEFNKAMGPLGGVPPAGTASWSGETKQTD